MMHINKFDSLQLKLFIILLLYNVLLLGVYILTRFVYNLRGWLQYENY